MFSNPSTPNITDFRAFVISQGVPDADLPTGSIYLQAAFDYADSLVIDPPPMLAPLLYVMAVYNLGMHYLLLTAQDEEDETYFEDMRVKYKLLDFIAGPIVATSDQGTSSAMLASDWMKNMTLSDNDKTKTPWGRYYLMYAQSYGPSIVGVS
jgi:hypothetical protein